MRKSATIVAYLVELNSILCSIRIRHYNCQIVPTVVTKCWVSSIFYTWRELSHKACFRGRRPNRILCWNWNSRYQIFKHIFFSNLIKIIRSISCKLSHSKCEIHRLPIKPSININLWFWNWSREICCEIINEWWIRIYISKIKTCWWLRSL